MKLLVRTRATFVPERRYVLDVVLSEWLGLDYELEFDDRPRTAIRVLGDAKGRELTLPDVLFSAPTDDWLTERSMPAIPLRRLPAQRYQPVDPGDRGEATGVGSPTGYLPIVFGEPWSEELAWRETAEGLELALDVFGSVFFLLTRYEEVVRRTRDEHERFPAAASLASAEGFLERPIVDEYVDVLWGAIRSLWPALVRPPRTFRLRLTHDVDEPFAAFGVGARAVARTAAGDVVRRGDPLMAVRRVRSFFDARQGRVDRNPFNTFDFLMDTSERHGLKAMFYFLAGDARGDLDGTYRLSDQPVAGLLRRVHDRGHDVGLHATYGTFRSPESTQAEFEDLKDACTTLGIDRVPRSVRQHFLRFENPQTWRNQELAGFEFDSTLGFADHIGFRAGTCREYPVFDLLDRRRLNLRERPLAVMDTTLFHYMALDLDEAAFRTRELVKACQWHGGDAVLLFHNTSLTTARQRAHYGDLVHDLVRRS